MQGTKTRVSIFDKQPMVRLGIRSVLEAEENCEVVGEYATLDAIFDLLGGRDIDVALVHTALFDSFSHMHSVMSSIRKLVPRFPVVFLAASANQETFFQAMRAGAFAYETRGLSPEKLVEVVLAASRGEYLLNEEVLEIQPLPLVRAEQLAVELRTDSHGLDELLSKRELEILIAIASGNSNKEISRLLEISDQTVKNHITSILRKTVVTDRTAAVVYALRKGWIKLEELQSVSV